MNKGKVTVRYEKNYRKLTIKALVGVVLTYVFASLAIDTGGLWYYLFTIIAAVFSVRVIAQFFKKR